MKLSEHVNWAVLNSEFTKAKEIQKDLLENHGIEVTIAEIKHILKQIK